MKADIITMHMINNYGSVLQTYATCEMFRMAGIEPEIIDYYPERLVGYGSLKQLYIDAKPFHHNTLKCLIVALVNWPSYKLQKRIFKPFVQKYIPLSNKYESFDELKKNPPIADIYCTGSDQVWNNYLDSKKQFDKAYFLDFISTENISRMAYAASFGRSDFNKNELKQIEQFLKKYDFISVREESGLTVLKKANIINGQCCLDPTFMVDKNIWLNMAEPIKEKDYILVYKLHEDSAATDIAIKLGKKYNKKVIRISTALHRRIKGGRTVMLPSVGKFISYLLNASLVVTDSFHATAFSINLNVPFVSVKWKMFNDRIESVLDVVGLQNKLVSNYQEAYEAVINATDYTVVNSKIKDAITKSQFYFNQALLGEGERKID
mgnify:CR=1 FL=1